jgi:hypothetical protein
MVTNNAGGPYNDNLARFTREIPTPPGQPSNDEAYTLIHRLGDQYKEAGRLNQDKVTISRKDLKTALDCLTAMESGLA